MSRSEAPARRCCSRKAAANTDPANFLELRKAEVQLRRISLPRQSRNAPSPHPDRPGTLARKRQRLHASNHSDSRPCTPKTTSRPLCARTEHHRRANRPDPLTHCPRPFCKGRAQLPHKRRSYISPYNTAGRSPWLRNRGASAQGAEANVEENERQRNVKSMRHVTFADSSVRGFAAGAPPFWPDFLGGSRRSAQSAGPLQERPTRCYTPTKIWPDSRHNEGSEFIG